RWASVSSWAGMASGMVSKKRSVGVWPQKAQKAQKQRVLFCVFCGHWRLAEAALQPTRGVEHRGAVEDEVLAGGDAGLDHVAVLPAAFGAPGGHVVRVVVLFVEEDDAVGAGGLDRGHVELEVTFGLIGKDVFAAGEVDQVVDEGEPAGDARMTAKPEFGADARATFRGGGAERGGFGFQASGQRVRGAHLAHE